MPKFKIVNDDGSTSEYKPVPKIPVKQVDTSDYVPPKVHPKKPVVKPAKVYPKKDTEPVKSEEVIRPEVVEEVKPLEEVKQEVVREVTHIEEVKPVPETHVVRNVDEEIKTPSGGMIFSPVVKKKHAEQKPVSKALTNDKVYALDQKAMDNLVNAIVDTLSDRFVSKDEVNSVVSSILQGMVMPNND